MSGKQRLDTLLLNRGLAPDQGKARAYIMAGEILVDGAIVDKPGTLLAADVEIVLRARPRYVSRGGEKLATALESFPLKVAGRVCADVGASTGGFTDCLLKNGASRVYALDVGYGHLAYALREDSRVVVMERTNARYVEVLPEKIDCVVIDASFISLRLLLPVIQGWLAPSADVIPLIKPQFEARRRDVVKGGVVQDREVHRQVLSQTLHFAVESGFLLCGLIRSPLKGPAGNVEFLAWLGWNNGCVSQSLESVIDAVL